MLYKIVWVRGFEYCLLPGTTLIFPSWVHFSMTLMVSGGGGGGGGVFTPPRTILQMENNLSGIFNHFSNYQINSKN